MIEYSEYKSLVDILSKSDVSNTYEDLMKKESSVLNTVNHVTQHIQDTHAKHKQFIHLSLYEVFMLIFLEIPKLVEDIIQLKDIEQLPEMLTKNHRIIILGVLCTMLAIFLFFIEISK